MSKSHVRIEGTMKDCNICRGARVIRLPVYRRVETWRVSANVERIEPRPIGESFRVYPCPECAESTPLERVLVLEAGVAVSDRVPAAYDHHAKRGAAHALVERLLEDGVISFRREPSKHPMAHEVVARLGVVSPHKVATLEARIAERQAEVAREVVEEAVRQINNWGSHYGKTWLEKDQAARFAREAVQTVLRKREKVPA